MKLSNIQKKFINSKPYDCNILKGKSNSGKSEALLHRILNVINNFAYEEEDKILFVQKNKGLKDTTVSRFDKIKEENKYTYMSLLSSDKKPEFLTLKEVINKYVCGLSYIKNSDKLAIIKECLKDNKNIKCKKINENNTFIILNEIKFMKNNRISTFEEYSVLMGGPLKLRKNSSSREDMYQVFCKYNNMLNTKGLVDEEDSILLAFKNFKNSKDNGYVHIFIDNVEELSKLELEFLLSLYKKKNYSTITMGIDTDKNENIYSSLIKKGRVYGKKNFGVHKKVFNFKVEINSNIIQHFDIKIRDNYKFIDLKHRRDFEFAIEHNGCEEKLVGENEERFIEEELESIPVFNNIAAGEPILITPEQEDTFTLPKYWVRGGNKKFILKVKGSSMKDANIHDGDLVVIEQNNAPLNGDIVAVNIDGNATLKTLKIGKNSVTLLPENKDYEPIIVSKDEEFYVLGKAIGVIRK